MRRLAALAGLAAALLLADSPAPALAAEPVDDAISALRTDHLYVAPGGSVTIDQDAVRRALGDQPIWLAVLPASAGKPVTLAERIGRALGSSGTVGVVVAPDFGASTNLLCPEALPRVVSRVLSDNRDRLAASDVTGLLREFSADVITAPQRGQDCAESGTLTSSGAGAGDEGGSVWPWVLGFGAVGVLGAGGGTAFLLSRRRRRLKELEGRHAEVLSLYDRLGADVLALDPTDDPVAGHALADAAERHTATGSLLSQADTDGEYDAARRTALEGLHAARTARASLGLDPGPDLPPIEPAEGEQLTERREVAVGDKTYQGFPRYTPGAPYYYGGGGGVPGGWYAFPFWETVLLGSVLGGGLGGWGADEGGYDRGYEAGREAGAAVSGDWESAGDGGWESAGGSWASGGWEPADGDVGGGAGSSGGAGGGDSGGDGGDSGGDGDDSGSGTGGSGTGTGTGGSGTGGTGDGGTGGGGDGGSGGGSGGGGE